MAKRIDRDLFESELVHRMSLWSKLVEIDSDRRVRAGSLRELRIYQGAQGIYVDKHRTQHLTHDSSGVTVSVLHTGKSYADDLADDGVIYHYPETKRRGKDESEIKATKSAGTLQLPVFVITRPTPSSSWRDVHLGWVEGWDDEASVFLITFGGVAPGALLRPTGDSEPFSLTAPPKGTKVETTSRPGQQRFKFQVLQRYGAECAVCGLAVKELLEAAHIRPKHQRGSDDPRNGLVLCSTHHRAFDRGFFRIDPDSLSIETASYTLDRLRLTCDSLSHLKLRPHPDALKWAWKHWREKPL